MAPAIAVCASITSVNVLSTKLDMESANLLLKVKAEKPNLRTLYGLTHNETELDLKYHGLGPGDAKLLAAEILVMASLTSLDLSGNALCGIKYGRGTYTAEGIKAIADALRVSASMTHLDVRVNSMGEEGKTVLRKAIEGRTGFELKL